MVAMLSSCNDFLELRPEYLISEGNFFKNQNDFEKALIGIYSSIRPLYANSSIIYVSDLTTDNTEIQWSSPTNDEMQFDQNNVTSTNGVISGIWNTCLYTISRSNTVLGKIDNVEFDQAVKDKIKGEAMFLRALSYFYMVRIFENVPISKEVFANPEQITSADLTLKPKEEVYKVIIEDLLAAEKLLPAALTADKTRASLGTVKTLLGKVYLTTKDFDKATLKLKEVIDAKQYSLVTNYKSLFTNGNNNLAESILEVQFTVGRSIGNDFSAKFSPAITSMALFPNNQQGSGRINPTQDIMNAYETGDLRKDASVSDVIPLINGTTVKGRYGKKFVDYTAIATSDGGVTFTVLRYADVLLMYAEALNEVSFQPAGEAFTYLNMVRTRAGLAKKTATEIPTQQAFRLAMEQERRVELAFEGYRWFDLVRTDRAITVLNSKKDQIRLVTDLTANNLVFPIPQSQIDINKDKIKQNPGY